MSVKKIFVILIGTVVLMVFSSVIIEIFNINVISQQLQQLTRTAASQSCELFVQESYKRADAGYACNMPDLKDSNGVSYISGNFYGSGNSTTLYNSIYKNNSSFSKLCTLGLPVDGSTTSTSHTINLGMGNKSVQYEVVYVSPSVKSAASDIYVTGNGNTVQGAIVNLNNLYYSVTNPS